MTSVTVAIAPGWKCERCRKVLPEVGLVPEAPDVCLRCASVLSRFHGLDVETLDVPLLAAARFDRFFVEEQAAGYDRAAAVTRAGLRNRGLTAEGHSLPPAERDRVSS